MLSIRRIQIKNFRQYQNVELFFDDSRDMHLFIGKNGMGKSNFLNAIYWCLYAHQPFKFHEEDKQLLNEETSKKEPNGEIKVELEIEMDDGRTTLFRRQLSEAWDNSKFTVMEKTPRGWEPVDDPTSIRNAFLPESISKFFLFDGEAVQKLYKGDYAKNLKEGILRVSDITVLDSSLEHVANTYEDIRKRVSKDNPDTNNQEKILEVLQVQKTKLESQYQLNESNIKNLKAGIQQLETKLDGYREYEHFQKEKRQLESDITDSEIQITAYREQVNNIITEYAPFWFIKEALVEIAIQINQAEKRGEIPPDINPDYVNQLIKNKQCICGTHINDGDSAYKYLNDLITKISPLSDRTYLIKDNVKVGSLIVKVSREIPNILKEIRNKRAQIRQRSITLKKQLDEIKEKLIHAPEREVGSIQITLNNNKNEIESRLKDKGQLELEIKQTTSQIQEILEKLEKMNRGKERFQMENNKANFLEEARDKLELIREKIIRQVRESVSAHTDRYFKELIWKKEDFDRISFTEDYSVEVLKRNSSSNSFKDLSTGEMKVLSLATIKALDILSGYSNVPLFVDGPLENLDEEVQENFLKFLPKFMENKHVFIFSLDKPVMLSFGNKVVAPENFYKLTRINSSHSTSIQKYD